jgi:penicillin-binding protein 2
MLMKVLRLIPVLLLACAACLPGSPATPTPSPTPTPPPGGAEQVAATFLSAWGQGDYAGMYSLLSERSQALVTQASFEARYRQFVEQGLITVVRASVKTALQQGERAQVGYDVSYETLLAGPFERTGMVMPLTYASGRWGVAWNDGLILPELAGGNVLYHQPRHPGRGNIYASDGTALALQGEAAIISVVPGQMTDEAAVVAALAPLLNLSAEDLRAKWANARADWVVPLGIVSQQTLAQAGLDLAQLPGVQLATQSMRFYPDRGLAAHVVGYAGAVPAEEVAAYRARGYTGDERVGLTGLEYWGEEALAGRFGAQLTVVTPAGDFVAKLAERPAQAATSLYTTIDRDLQQAAEEVLSQPVNGVPARGAIVVLDPRTGAVLAMASMPTFDPNLFGPAGQNSAALAAVLNDPARPLINRAAQATYPLGSVFKLVTISAALESGEYTAGTLYHDTGTWDRLGADWVKTDWLAGGHGTITLKQALTFSCDPYFYDVGFNLDKKDATLLPTYARWFGLGRLTGIRGILEDEGLVPDSLWKLENEGVEWFPGDSVNLAIGQGYLLVTPLQVAQMYGAVANGGTLYQPYLIDHTAAAGEPAGPVTAPVESGKLPVTAEHLQTIQEALHDVTVAPGGTAVNRFVGLSVPVAGKTGTAENALEEPHSWFAGYTMAGDPIHPDIAIVVLVENAGEGTSVAAPIFRRIVEKHFDLPVTPLPWEQGGNP